MPSLVSVILRLERSKRRAPSFQLGQLTGKRRLRHVETLRCLCDISLSGGRQKIMNHTHVHDFLLPVKGRLDN